MNDMNKAAGKVTEVIEIKMCKDCAQYERGCKPGQVIACTKYFHNIWKKVIQGFDPIMPSDIMKSFEKS